MEKSTIKKIAFWIGLVFNVIVVMGFFDNFNKALNYDESTPFAILSLFGSGFMIYGMYTTTESKKKNSLVSMIVSSIIWIYLIINLFNYDNNTYNNFYINFIILAISATTLLLFAMNNLIKLNDNQD